MKKLYLLLLLLVAGIGIGGLLLNLPRRHVQELAVSDFRTGDVVFHTALSRQAMVIQLATHSPYSHCGVLFQRDSTWWVLEAVQPVSSCPLSDWIRRGKEGRYVVKRLKEDARWKSRLDSLSVVAATFRGKPYDPWFGPGDDRLYGSELVWKLYDRALGIHLGAWQPLGSLDLSAPQVQEVLYTHYGEQLPLADSLITPAAIFRSPELKTVFANGAWIR